ncbi:FAD-dependent oxidoreductase, partial [bacterium]|nr:FAD-dependent oxidoreductase [bacterium]
MLAKPTQQIQAVILSLSCFSPVWLYHEYKTLMNGENTMKRREFLTYTLSATALSYSQLSFGEQNAINNQPVDVLVAGGGLVGCCTALQAAKSGARVLLVEPRNYLGREITATLRPWIGTEGLDTISDSLRTMIPYEKPENSSSPEAMAPIGALKKSLARVLREHGVQILLLSQPVAVLTQDEQTVGLVVANKGGLQAIPAKTIID